VATRQTIDALTLKEWCWSQTSVTENPPPE
jgi:hypothetical protein